MERTLGRKCGKGELRMKKTILALVMLSLFPFSALAECEWKTGITKLPSGTFEYSRDCHFKVGETVRDLGIAKEQYRLTTEALTLKDLAISKADARAELWMQTSYSLEKRIETLDKMNTQTKWIYFGLGVLATSAAIYGASQLSR